MRFIFRTDASRWIGSGHVMRCLVLADALKNKGHEITFACRQQPSDLNSFIVERGHKLVVLPAHEEGRIPLHTADYESWLQVHWQRDCEEFLNAIPRADWVVIDHYGIPKEWETTVATKLECRLLVIDDLAREHDCDALIDQTALRSESIYIDKLPEKSKRLVGSKYALLNPGFAKWRNQIKGIERDARRVLISMGGIDEPNATLSALQALTPHFDEMRLTVLLSQRAPHYQQVKSYCERYRDRIEHIDFSNDVAGLMANHGLAIGAPGATSWERACLGLPSVIVPLAENQNSICENLVKAEASLCISVEKIDSSLWPALLHLKKKYLHYQDRCWDLCDGKGCERVVRHLLNG